ncbi:hypothetical protein RQP46_003429 [Phenoliferia psychrophenolica]
MPPRRRAAAVVVVPALPLEVVESIIKHSLPAVAEDTFGERYLILRTYQSVNKAWAGLAQRELHRYVKLSTPARAVAYLKRGLYGRPDEVADAARMQFLQLGMYSNGHGVFPILELLIVCPRLTELHLINLQAVDAATLSVAVDLRTLHLHDTSFIFRDEYLLYLPNLVSLSIADIECHDAKNRNLECSRLLHSLSLPQLTYVALHWVPVLQYLEEHTRIHYEGQMTLPSLGAIGDRVRTLVIGRYETPQFKAQIETELAECTALQHLTINNPEDLDGLLAALPQSLRTLQVGAYYHRATALDLDDEYILPMMYALTDTTGVRDLEVLSIPEVWDWGGENDDGLLRQNREHVRKLCKTEELDLVERPLDGQGQDERVEDWRDVLLSVLLSLSSSRSKRGPSLYFENPDRMRDGRRKSHRSVKL